ncbi:ATP-binding protein [Pseudarthrobacter siccitolerans]
MPHARAVAPELIATARAQRWEPTEIIKALFTGEAAGRAPSMLATRRKGAGFPTGKTFDAWDPTVSSIPAPTQQALRTLEWIGRRENLVVCRPSGTGKTFFLEALGQQAVEAGMRVAWFRLEDLGALIRAHRTDDAVTRAVARILRAELVVIDDIGLLPVATDAAEGPHRVRGRRLRKALRCDQLEPAPGRLRRTHAQDPGHRHRRPAPAPRPRLPNQRRLHPPHPGPRRKRSHPAELTRPDDGQSHRTRVGRSIGHHRAVLLATSGHLYWPPMGRNQRPLTLHQP